MDKVCMNCSYCRIVEVADKEYRYYCQRSSRNENIADMEEVAAIGTCSQGKWDNTNVE